MVKRTETETEKEMKKYEFQMICGNSTVLAIVINPTFKDGVMTATKVGKFVGFLSEKGGYAYKACEPVEFIAGGGPYSLEEYTSEL